jgi:hypothetical protein
MNGGFCMPLKGSPFMAPERMVLGCGVVKDTGTYAKQLGAKKYFWLLMILWPVSKLFQPSRNH